MNEEDLLNLKLAGYAYKYGAIIDAEGNYVKNVDLNGKIYSSGISKEDYNLDVESVQREETFELQQEQAKNQQRQNLQDYSKDPILNHIRLHSNYKNLEVTSTNKKEIVKSTITIKDGIKSSSQAIYKYPVVLVASIIIYLLIKKLIK